SSLDLSGYPAAAQLSVELVRKGPLGDVVIGHAAGIADAGGALHIGAGGTCWSTFTPEIRAGDTVRVSMGSVTDSAVVPGLTVNWPGLATGTGTQVTGDAPDGPVKAELLDAGGATIETQDLTAAAGTWTAPFAATLAAGARATVIDAGNTTVVENPLPPRADCPPTSPFNATAVTAIDPGHVVAGTPTINAAGAGQNLIVQGPAGDAALTLTATLNGGAPEPAPVIGGILTATFPAADLAKLPDGQVTVGVTGGVGLTMTKDTVAPGPPTSTPPPGRYLTAPSVTLAPPEPGAQVR